MSGRRPVALVLAAAAAAGCGDAPVATPPPEHFALLAVGGVTEAGGAAEQADVSLLADVVRRELGCPGGCPFEPVTDAAVAAGVEGDLAPLVYGAEDGYFEGSRLGWADAFVIRVEVDGEVLEGRAPTPSFFTVAIVPDPVAAGAAAELSWAPNGEEGVRAVADVASLALGTTYVTAPTGEFPDDGVEPLPASAFPQPGAYQARVQRDRLAGEGRVSASVTLTVHLPATAH